MTIAFVPATQQLLERFYGGPPPHTTRAMVVLDGDEPIGIGGIYADDDRFVFYAEVTERLRSKKKTFLKAAIAAVKIAREAQARAERPGFLIPVHARAELSIPGSGALLERIGFVRLVGDVYGLRGED